MKATIRISEIEINTILRERILRLPGVDKITSIKPVLTFDRHEEQNTYEGHDIEVELKENS